MKFTKLRPNKLFVWANQAGYHIENLDYCLIKKNTALPNLGNAMLNLTRKVCSVPKLGKTLQNVLLPNTNNQRLTLVRNSTVGLSNEIIWLYQTPVSVVVT